LDLDSEGVTFYFDYLDVSLRDIIEARCKQNCIFLEEEIVAAMDALLSALEYLKVKGIEGGNIEPSTIFYDKGKIKIYLNELVLGNKKNTRNLLTYIHLHARIIAITQQLSNISRRANE